MCLELVKCIKESFMSAVGRRHMKGVEKKGAIGGKMKFLRYCTGESIMIVG